MSINIEFVFGVDIASIINKKIFERVLAELKHKRLMADIRGERYVPVYYTDIGCLNCYAYGRIDEFGFHDCSCHDDDIRGNVKKLSYLKFIKAAALIRTDFLYLHGRLQNGIHMPDDLIYKRECTDPNIFTYNLDHIGI